jgi:hypothetical protein
MQFEEEELNQEEAEGAEPTEEFEMEPLDADEEKQTRQKLETAKPKAIRGPGMTGIWLTVFAAIVIIMLGGLASYYYFTFQRQGVDSEKSVKSVWEDVADSTEKLTSAFGGLQKFQDITDRSNTSLSVALDQTNRTVRDGGFDMQNQTGLDVRAASVGSKMAGFFDDYGKYLLELRRVIDHADTILEPKDLDGLKNAAKDAESSYDDLLAVNNGFLKASLPRSVFDMGDKLVDLLNKMIEENGSVDEKDKAQKQAANEVVTKFTQAWQDRDVDAMSVYLTSGAKADLTPATLENSTDVVGLSISDTIVAEDGSKITVKGKLKLAPPGGAEVTENWQFVLLPTGDKWLIDSWKKI